MKPEDFAKRLEEKKPGRYELLTEYKGSNRPISAMHRPCGRVRTVSEARDLIRKGCQFCRRPEYTAEKVARIWSEHFREIEELGFVALTPFTGRRDPVLWKCKTCGRTFLRNPEDAVVRGISCSHEAAADQAAPEGATTK